MNVYPDVFVSYHHGNGNAMAQLIDVMLKACGYSAIDLTEGSLSLCRVRVPRAEAVVRLTIDDKEVPFELKEGELCFEKRSVARRVKAEYRLAV